MTTAIYFCADVPRSTHQLLLTDNQLK